MHRTIKSAIRTLKPNICILIAKIEEIQKHWNDWDGLNAVKPFFVGILVHGIAGFVLYVISGVLSIVLAVGAKKGEFKITVTN